jgi:hypothetical protein
MEGFNLDLLPVFLGFPSGPAWISFRGIWISFREISKSFIAPARLKASARPEDVES